MNIGYRQGKIQGNRDKLRTRAVAQAVKRAVFGPSGTDFPATWNREPGADEQGLQGVERGTGARSALGLAPAAETGDGW